jgi:fermentation-respiration switch protein FrsA (DUF1100 family)
MIKAVLTSWRRRLVRWRVLAVGCYVGVIAVLMALENRLIYRPVTASEDWQPPPFSPVEDVRLTLPEDVSVHAWWCPREDATSALLYCHGNVGNLSHRGRVIQQLQGLLDVSVLIFDYPGYGKSTGRPTEQGCYAAADAAYDWLAHKVRPERILLYGSSLGGGVAVDLASRRPHRALVLDKSFTSMPEVAQQLYPWLPVRWLMHNRYDNLAKIGKCRRPVFVGHGTTDDLVPFAQGERVFAAANEPKRFFRMDACGHNDPLPRQFFDALRDFLAEVESKQSAHAATPVAGD